MHKLLVICILLLSWSIVIAEPERRDTPPDGSKIALEKIADNIVRPIYAMGSGDGSNRLFVVSQEGQIFIIDENGELLETPFLDIREEVTELEIYDEQGLLGLTFHPDFITNRRFFVNYTQRRDDATIIVEYKASEDNPNIADPESRRPILFVEQPEADHNAGAMSFGLDGYLYIGFGDGGGSDESRANAQDLSNILGTIIRINVDKENAPYGLLADNPYVSLGGSSILIWVYGLRNPHKFAFDRQTGDLYISDVGELSFEELNFLPGDQMGGANYGWPLYEGRSLYDTSYSEKEDMVMPIVDYDRRVNGCAIIGGQVYYGEAIPEIKGIYIYADWCTGDFYSVYRNFDEEWQNEFLMNSGVNITGIDFGDDGELYTTYYSLADGLGGVMKLVANE